MSSEHIGSCNQLSTKFDLSAREGGLKKTWADSDSPLKIDDSFYKSRRETAGTWEQENIKEPKFVAPPNHKELILKLLKDKPSGVPLKLIAERLGIPEHTAYYHLKSLRKHKKIKSIKKGIYCLR